MVALIFAGGFGACGKQGILVHTTFDDVGDLQARHSVQIADVRVGEIRSVRLTRDYRADVTLALRPGVKVPRDSTAFLRTTSLLGEKFVELRPNGDPAKGPYLRDGDRIAQSAAAPELEFVAEQAVTALGSVVAGDVATLIESGAESFGGRGSELHDLLADLASISRTLADRTPQIEQIIDHLDQMTATLAGGSDDLASLLSNLAATTQVLADNRDRAIQALAKLSRLARVQNDLLVTYRSDMDRQIKQVDAVLAVAAGQTGELGLLLDWLERFVAGTPAVVPGDFAQVYGWFIPQNLDARPTGAAGDRVK